MGLPPPARILLPPVAVLHTSRWSYLPRWGCPNITLSTPRGCLHTPRVETCHGAVTASILASSHVHACKPDTLRFGATRAIRKLVHQ